MWCIVKVRLVVILAIAILKNLAATEARILTNLIIKSTRTQARLHHLLTHEQQKKLEDLNRFK